MACSSFLGRGAVKEVFLVLVSFLYFVKVVVSEYKGDIDI